MHYFGVATLLGFPHHHDARLAWQADHNEIEWFLDIDDGPVALVIQALVFVGVDRINLALNPMISNVHRT